MADLSITAANVARVNGEVRTGTAGATITAGAAVYYDVSASTWKLAQADGTAAESGGGTGSEVGIALNGAASTQPIDVQVTGDITIGATVALGTIYAVSATAGAIAPESDLTSGQYVTALGVPTTTGRLRLFGTRGISGVAHA
jgi:hypothetical protein